MAGSLYTTLVSNQGYIPLPLASWRLVASNDVPAIAVASGNGGNMALDSAPKLIRVNAATDKCLTMTWAASSSIEIFQQFLYPPDMDVTATYTVNLLCKMSGATDVPQITIGIFEGIGDTARNGSCPALSNVLGTRSVTVTPTTGFPNFATCILTPGTHTSDAIAIYGSYVLYQKKLLAT